ncbi:hypothetical protein PLESTM_001094200 [Pleodorina starrii]|nr:hypothetical protein PLESTM_001094200 [Pleodorina starrii]
MDQVQHGQPLEATVGLAFLPKKLPRVLTPELRSLAAAAGLRLLALDPHRPLDEQAATATTNATTAAPGGRLSSETAPIDIILHKLHADSVWEAHVERYVALYPWVCLLDPPTAIHATEDRALMLAAIPPSGLLLHVPPALAAPQEPACGARQQQQQQQQTERQRPRLGSQAAAVEMLTAAAGRGGSYGGGSDVAGWEDGDGGGGGDKAVTTADANAAAAAAAAAGWGSRRGRLVLVRAPAQAVVRSRGELRALLAAGEQGADG